MGKHCSRCKHWNKKKKRIVYAGLNSVYSVYKCKLVSGPADKSGAVAASRGRASGEHNADDFVPADLYTDAQWGCIQFAAARKYRKKSAYNGT